MNKTVLRQRLAQNKIRFFNEKITSISMVSDVPVKVWTDQGMTLTSSLLTVLASNGMAIFAPATAQISLTYTSDQMLAPQVATCQVVGTSLIVTAVDQAFVTVTFSNGEDRERFSGKVVNNQFEAELPADGLLTEVLCVAPDSAIQLLVGYSSANQWSPL